jgi:pantoate--beta-alanine ligase
MIVIRTVAEMQSWTDAARRKGQRIALVPTMGYLHEGHLALVRIARTKADVTVVSIFVNPLQFGPAEDLAAYPRDAVRDESLLRREGADVVFHPEVAEMYPPDFTTNVQVERLSDGLCGRSRPGHFRGVTTVVAKLFNAVRPHVAVFGGKDAQQAGIIQRMNRDLDFGIDIIIAPTVRESDGLALSSRNTYLSQLERRQAPVLYRALQYGARLIELGERNPQMIIPALSDMIMRETSGRIDYISIVDTETFADVTRVKSEVLIALAVSLGKTRLIDNILAQPPL